MKTTLLILITSILVSCGATKNTDISKLNYQNFKRLIENGDFEIESQFALPRASAALNRVANTNILGYGNNASSINIINNTNYFRKKGDSVSAYLPYYGEQNMPTRRGTNGGIEFDGVPEKYNVTFDDKKQMARINFEIDDKNNEIEHYDVEILLYGTYKSEIRINTARRSPISYTGSFEEMKE